MALARNPVALTLGPSHDDPGLTSAGDSASSEPMSDDAFSIRRKRILYRANHRGMRELDMLIGQFADKRVGSFTEAEADAFEALMAVEEPELMAWITGQQAVPAAFDTPLFREMMAMAGKLSAEKL
jgi:antitoxin CptB